MTLDLKRIYALLPAIYRTRDIEQGGPLEALLAVLTEQFQVLEDSLEQSYDDQFIETCAEWVVPYIGELVGVRALQVFPQAQFSLRGQVANTLTNRRRKGTVSVLEGLARDLTGWDVNVAEFFQVLATTQYMKHVRPTHLSFVEVRSAESRLLQTPFDSAARTADVRNIDTLRGRYNIPNIGIFLWRIPSLRIGLAPLCRVATRRYTFDPAGRDIALQTAPASRNDAGRVTPLNVPMPISRRLLYRDLQVPASPGAAPHCEYYGPDASVYLAFEPATSPPAPLPVICCNLSDVTDAGGNVVGWAHQPTGAVAVDPQLGRVAFPSDQPEPDEVHGTYCYGFSANIGGGPYERDLAESQDVLIRVPGDAASLQVALDQAMAQLTGEKTSAVVEIQDSGYYLETPSVTVPAGADVTLRSASTARPTLVLSGDFNILGHAESSFTLDGLWVAGGCIALPALDTADGSLNRLSRLTLSHCTLLPGPTPAIGAVAAQPVPGPRLWIECADVSLSLNQCITGSLRTVDECDVSIVGSIVDALDPTEVAYAGLDSIGPGGRLTVATSTLIGKLHSSLVRLASNCIFFARLLPADPWVAPVMAEQLQQGCVRFSYVPPGSQVPRPYRCRPAAGDPATLGPQFTSLRCGDAGYCQLAVQSGDEILSGADDQSQMGVFHDLMEPQREANLRGNLRDYLRFGLQAGLFHAS